MITEKTIDAIEIPREKNLHNDGVTKDIEAFLLDLFSRDESEAFHFKELTQLVRRQFASKYGDDLKAHTMWAIQAHWFNNFIKKVAPNTFEADSGPDPVYADRETGHAAPGEYSRRSYNVNNKDAQTRFGSRAEFKHQLDKAELSVKMLKNMGYNDQKVRDTLEASGNFDATLVKIAQKKLKGFEVSD